MEQKVTAWPWRQGLASQGQTTMPRLHGSRPVTSSCTGSLTGRGSTVKTGMPTLPYRSCTAVRSSHPSSRPWRNPMTPSTLTLSSHPVHPKVWFVLGWYRREAGSQGHLGRQGWSGLWQARVCGQTGERGLTLCPHLILPDSHSRALWALCVWVRGWG